MVNPKVAFVSVLVAAELYGNKGYSLALIFHKDDCLFEKRSDDYL